MRIFLCLIMVSMILYSLTDQGSFAQGKKDVEVSLQDTFRIGSVESEVNHRNRTRIYFAIQGKDTSLFKCRLSESSEGRIVLRTWFHPSMSYQKQMNELTFILAAAKDSFQLDSLRSLSIGRLHSTGDLAIEVSNQYLQQNKKFPSTVLNKEISEFLLTSKLADDFNSILKPYSVAVSTISSEKAFFADKKYLYSMSKIETDSGNVPSKILDTQLWIGIQRAP